MLICSAPEELRASGTAGAIEALACQEDRLLVGYTRGLIVVFDLTLAACVHTYAAGQGVESLCWHATGTKFMSSHNDGSYVVWSALAEEGVRGPAQAPNIPFGMPRASFGDKCTVAVQRKNKQSVFDCSSKVLDVLTLDTTANGDAHTLIILCEEGVFMCVCARAYVCTELIAIDLLSAAWLPFQLPYLRALHTSPISACTHVANVNASVVDMLTRAHNTETTTKHEDGYVRIWSSGGVCMRLVYELQSAQLYDAYTDPDTALAADDDDWPPFKKVGAYDPFSDDPRFTVQRVSMCANTGTLVIGGSAGQTLVCTMRTSADDTSSVHSQLHARIIADTEPNFTWKGNEPLSVARTQLKSIAYTAAMLVQCQPPAAVTAVAIDSNEKL
ncbi:unnamed protein product [Sphagnum balticum]